MGRILQTTRTCPSGTTTFLLPLPLQQPLPEGLVELVKFETMPLSGVAAVAAAAAFPATAASDEPLQIEWGGGDIIIIIMPLDEPPLCCVSAERGVVIITCALVLG